MGMMIDKPLLREALLAWGKAHREGKTLGHEAAAARSVEENADAAADYLWDVLLNLLGKDRSD